MNVIARQPLVTRTFYVTVAKIMFLDLETEKTFEREIITPKVFKNDEMFLKAITKRITEKKLNKKLKPIHVKPIHVISKSCERRLYGMKEEDFIENAVLMTDRKQKI